MQRDLVIAALVHEFWRQAKADDQIGFEVEGVPLGTAKVRGSIDLGALADAVLKAIADEDRTAIAEDEPAQPNSLKNDPSAEGAIQSRAARLREHR
jgi:hypothetical protein